MIDGVKINCLGTPPEKWINNPTLNFCSKVNQQTGEILSTTQIAFYKGLQFSITPSNVFKCGFSLSVRGSLATFYNEGKHNAFDFDTVMLKMVIEELQTNFSINPNKARVTSFEFGANINPSKPVKRILEGLRAYQNNTFSGLKMDGVFNGLQLKRQNTTFKAYDKGQQIGKKEQNTLRVEYCLKYSKEVNKYGFYNLIDLLDINKLNNIKQLLVNVWENSIFFDNQFKRQTLQRMTDKQQKKFLLYLDSTFWSDSLTKMQRKRAKDNFNTLCVEFCTSSTKTEITNLLTAKLDKLTAVKCYQLQPFEVPQMEAQKNTKMLPFTTLDKPVNSNKNNNKKSQKTNNQKKPKKAQIFSVKKCIVCSKDISHKKQNAVYCSKHCNNSKQATKRKIERHKTKNAENLKLSSILNKIKSSNLNLTIDYKHNGSIYSDQLQQKEIKAPKEWILKITKVVINRPHPVTLTSWNAKRLIKAISINAPP